MTNQAAEARSERASRQPLSPQIIWPLLGAASIAFHLWLIFSGLIPNLVSRPLHMTLALPWVLVFIAKTRFARATGVPLTILGVTCCLYIAWNQSALGDQYGFLETTAQYWIAGALILLVLEMARRAIGSAASSVIPACLSAASSVRLPFPRVDCGARLPACPSPSLRSLSSWEPC